jgi:hypothetical protein
MRNGTESMKKKNSTRFGKSSMDCNHIEFEIYSFLNRVYIALFEESLVSIYCDV